MIFNFFRSKRFCPVVVVQLIIIISQCSHDGQSSRVLHSTFYSLPSPGGILLSLLGLAFFVVAVLRLLQSAANEVASQAIYLSIVLLLAVIQCYIVISPVWLRDSFYRDPALFAASAPSSPLPRTSSNTEPQSPCSHHHHPPRSFHP